jgi:hypothetical protein
MQRRKNVLDRAESPAEPEAQNGGSTPEAVTVPLWPDAGETLGLKRGATYASAASGSIPTWRFGKQLRVSKGWLDKVARGDLP